MHGRLKVKTTTEQDAEKQKERQKKLLLYTGGCQKAAEKRNQQEFDSEALAITGQLLQGNPDHYTLWNFRKEILLFLKSDMISKNEDVQELLEKELYLTEACLRKNPKSYGAWRHRVWVLQEMPKPDWKKELQTCRKFFNLDDRNFHLWDYRRTVCRLAEVDKADELAFTLEQIQKNFSNYSAWHYRSSVLPLVHPGNNAFGPGIDQETLHNEYELVQNAAFTDPNDQSAWFYHRWLLGRAEVQVGLQYCYLDQENQSIVVVFTKAIEKSELEKLSLLVNGDLSPCEWHSPVVSDFASTVWISNVAFACNAEISISFGGRDEDSLNIQASDRNLVWKPNSKETLFSCELSAATSEVLQRELESCQQLLELEPGNKWTLLTCVLLLRAIDSQSNEKKALEYLDQLLTVDSKRKNYYKDMRSKFVLENRVSRFLSSSENSLNLGQLSLTLFCHADCLTFLEHLDLYNNNISSLKPLRYLVSMKELVLDQNCIEDCSGLEGMSQLRCLSLNSNCFRSIENLQSLKACSSLKLLNILENPINEVKNYLEDIKLLLPTLLHLNS